MSYCTVHDGTTDLATTLILFALIRLHVSMQAGSQLPSLAAAAAAYEADVAGNGSSCQQLPPLFLQQPRGFDNHLQDVRAEKQCVVHPRNRGGGSGGDGGGGDSFFCPAPVVTDAQRQEPYCFPYRPLPADDVNYPQGGHWDGGNGAPEVCRWEEALPDGTITGLHMLSESAARLSGDTDKVKHNKKHNDRQSPSGQI